LEEKKLELDDNLYEQIVTLCNGGDTLVEEGDVDHAIRKYLTALNLVPSPKNEWEASTWIYTALGDAYFINEEYVFAKKQLL